MENLQEQTFPLKTEDGVTSKHFYYMFNSGDDQALLNCCGVDHKVFRQLLELFQPAFETYVPCHKTRRIRPIRRKASGKPIGHKRGIDGLGCLGLLLYWFQTRGSCARAISWAFRLTSTLLLLSEDSSLYPKEQAICKSSNQTNQPWVALLHQCYWIKIPHPWWREKVWGATDGLKIPLQTSTIYGIQKISISTMDGQGALLISAGVSLSSLLIWKNPNLYFKSSWKLVQQYHVWLRYIAKDGTPVSSTWCEGMCWFCI